MKVFYGDYYEDERLYSTGYDDLDDLMEDAFLDGYEYAARLFAEGEPTPEPKKTEKGPNVFQKTGRWVKNTWNADEATNSVKNAIEKKQKKLIEKAKKNGKVLSEADARKAAQKIVKRWNRGLMIGVPTAIAAAGTTAGIVAHNKKKQRRLAEMGQE